MLEKFKKSLDDAFLGIKTGASKLTLRTEEKARITRLNLKINSLKKDLDGVMTKLGNRLYTFREEQHQENVFQDAIFSEIFEEADSIKEQMVNLQDEMEKIKEDFNMRIQGLTIPEGAETIATGEERAEAEKKRKAS